MKRTREIVLTVASVVGMGTSAAAGLTIWLLLTQPLTVANAVNARDLAPLLQAMASALVDALSVVIRYL
ncbi:MAG: hypothetical protein HY047_11365 [Acidobacteria bacterium]|nr:hypothetical protein [Acidobacteriota bacterium]